MMVDRVFRVLPGLASSTQAGFAKGRSPVINIRKVLLVLDRVRHLPRAGESPALIANDAEKAFDNFRWSWLFTVLDEMDYGGPFQTFLSSLYASPSVRMYISGFLI